MKIALTGDVMLGRLVNRYVMSNSALSPEAIWGDTLPLFNAAGCRLINLECVISTRGQPWNPRLKPFHFRANPRAIEILQAARVDCATLANNHVLDYGPDALLDCLTFLDEAHIQHTGAGAHMDEALKPALLEYTQGRIAVVALTDNEPEWEATKSQPGVNYVGYDTQGLLSPYLDRIAEVIQQARQNASFVIISAHIGPNWGEPSPAMRKLTHQLLDLGGDLYWGHSNHTPQGIEIYKGKVILYSTGDFVDDYAVDLDERNDLSFLFSIEETSGRVARIQLYPVRIENFQVHRATGSDITFLQHSLQAKCRAFHTDVIFQDGIGTITVT
ncbi:MAG: capsular biosynthesis protein [Nitrospirae bacterium CG_4_9_14_3_um_filter_51_5]|nr:MAG: capsular biosynthesis protein [Nitrospirae bacterium CG_4_9_14_3_um_filter_51_5]